MVLFNLQEKHHNLFEASTKTDLNLEFLDMLPYVSASFVGLSELCLSNSDSETDPAHVHDAHHFSLDPPVMNGAHSVSGPFKVDSGNQYLDRATRVPPHELPSYHPKSVPNDSFSPGVDHSSQTSSTSVYLLHSVFFRPFLGMFIIL